MHVVGKSRSRYLMFKMRCIEVVIYVSIVTSLSFFLLANISKLVIMLVSRV